MIFDHVHALPVATARPARRSWRAELAIDLQRWLRARWTWFRPRTVPMLVAAIGAVAMLHAVDYLAHPPAPAAATHQAQAVLIHL